MSMNQKEELRTQNMIRFIEAARELIDQEGLESLSIRKIAEKAGFHNSTIYLYFRDMDHLRTHGFPKSPYFLQLFLRKTQ